MPDPRPFGRLATALTPSQQDAIARMPASGAAVDICHHSEMVHSGWEGLEALGLVGVDGDSASLTPQGWRVRAILIGGWA